MALCSNCGREMGTGVYCGGCGQRTGGTTSTPIASVVHNNQPPVGGSLRVSPGTSSAKMSRGIGITLIVSGAVGAGSPFMPWAKGSDSSIDGWMLADVMSLVGKFSQGPLFTLLSGVCAVYIGFRVLNGSGKNIGLNLRALGGVSSVAGSVMSLSAGAMYYGIVDIRRGRGYLALGNGLVLAAVCGFVIALLGLAMRKKSSPAGAA